ncbi:MAG: VTT domain-containing protein [Clostridia bacterium]|nr:VTT domain-containing protein [Clostridia bacterium]
MEQKKNYDKLVKALQIASGVFMAAMLVTAVVLMKKYNISVKNVEVLKDWIQGSTLTVALILIGFTIVKAFALVITPSIVFVLSGILFRDTPHGIIIAIVVNMIAIALSTVIPYYLGRFTGKGMAETLKKRFPKVKKFDDFAGENEFIIVFLIKACGLLPGDVTSLVFGAMDISPKNFFLAGNLGVLPLNILWVLAGNKGNFSDPKTLLYVLPVLLFALGASLFVKWYTKRKKNKQNAE